MGLVIYGPSGGGGVSWEDAHEIDFSAEATASYGDGHYYDFQGFHLRVSNNGQDRNGMSITNGQGFNIAPASGCNYSNCPGFYINDDVSELLPIADWGFNPPVRTMIEFYSYSGGSPTDCCSGGLTRQPWGGMSTDANRLVGLAADGSPCGWLTHNTSTTLGVLTTQTDVDGYKYCIMEMPTGYFSLTGHGRYNNTDAWETAPIIFSWYWDGINMGWIDSLYYDKATNNRPFLFCCAGHGGSTGTGSFTIKKIKIQAKRVV